jgi:hypothetical protein
MAGGIDFASADVMTWTQSLTAIGAGVTLQLTLACERGPALKPAAGTTQPRGLSNAVMQSQHGVRVIAQSRDWPGKPDVEEVVTPLRIIVQNQSDKSLQIRYGNFMIIAPNRVSYAAVPPRQVIGAVKDGLYIRPAFSYAGFYSAPYYGSHYYDVPPYTGPFPYDAPYYETYYQYWQRLERLPTPEMLARALPEGVIAPGGSLDGYLYFAKLRQEHGTTVTLQVRLKATDGDQGNSAQLERRLPPADPPQK